MGVWKGITHGRMLGKLRTNAFTQQGFLGRHVRRGTVLPYQPTGAIWGLIKGV